MARWRVLGISLGSRARDFQARWVWKGGVVEICRLGTEGDFRRAAELLRRYEGSVNAFGLGGVNLYLRAAQRFYRLPAGWELARVPERTPVCDGTWIKARWEPRALGLAVPACGLELAGKKVLFSSVLDRWELAAALEQAGACLLVGDAAFALRVPVLFPGLRAFYPWAVVLVPWLRRLPLSWLYPLGRRREEARGGLEWAFRRAEVLAGDFHLLRWRLPLDLKGKWVLSSGLGSSERDMLRKRGVVRIVELAPVLEGRGLSANLTEAVVAAVAARPPECLPEDEFLFWCGELGFRPSCS